MKSTKKPHVKKGKSIRFIPGIHSVREILFFSPADIIELWISQGKVSPMVNEIIEMANDKGVSVFHKKSSILENILPGVSHQGVVALAREYGYIDAEDLIHSALNAPAHALLIAADHITDEGNLGAIIRSAAFFGVHGLILPKDRSAKITQNLMKRSSGAYIHLPVARVVNLGRILDNLNKRGFWIIGAAVESTESIYQFDWQRDLVLVVGSEEKGLSPSIRNRCHQLVGIPATEPIGVLNVSVATGIILSEIIRQRNQSKSE
jgi:23S rRNA (guanosine2251-2'-O)-methyltransferase